MDGYPKGNLTAAVEKIPCCLFLPHRLQMQKQRTEFFENKEMLENGFKTKVKRKKKAVFSFETQKNIQNAQKTKKNKRITAEINVENVEKIFKPEKILTKTKKRDRIRS